MHGQTGCRGTAHPETLCLACSSTGATSLRATAACGSGSWTCGSTLQVGCGCTCLSRRMSAQPGSPGRPHLPAVDSSSVARTEAWHDK